MRPMRGLLALLLVTVLSAAPLRAVQPDEVLPNAGLEHRAREISAGLRCLVCQNQSIDDSDAPLARDLRILVRERLTAGDSDVQVRDFVVARYGDFVLLRPPVNYRTMLLWAAPFVILALGLAFLWRRGRRLAAAPAAPLSAEERERVEALMQDRRGD